MRLDDRLQAELPAPEEGIDDVLALLLRHCRDEVVALREATQNPAAVEYRSACGQRFANWFNELDDVALLPEDVPALREELGTACIDAERTFGVALGDALVARAAADAIDLVLGPRLIARFRRRGMLRLVTGSGVPVAAPPLREIFGRELGTRPESRGLELDTTSHLRILGTLAAGLSVQLATNRIDLLSTLEHPDAELAVAWTTSTDALEFERDAPAGRPRFHSVRPHEPAAVNAAVTKAFADLSRPRAPTVVVLPELSLDPGGVQAARAEFERLGRPFDVVVLGSAHTALAERGCENVSTVCFRDGADGEHHKFNPFVLVLPDANGTRVPHTEALRLGERVLTVHLGTRWSLTVLICKDLIDPGVTEALASVLVRIVLVPARTPRTSDFEAEALAHAARSQGIVVVANDVGADSEPAAAAALIARPLRRGGLQRFPQPDGARPTVLRARLRG